MKCKICKIKEFSVVYESHLPIEDQPVFICYRCFRKGFSNMTEYEKGCDDRTDDIISLLDKELKNYVSLIGDHDIEPAKRQILKIKKEYIAKHNALVLFKDILLETYKRSNDLEF